MAHVLAGDEPPLWSWLSRPGVRAVVLGAGGLLLLAAAPEHRLDLRLAGLAAALAGFVWRPVGAAVAVAAALPFHLVSREVGPLPFTPPGLALGLGWLAIGLRVLGARLGLAPAPRLAWPRTAYDGPIALLLLAALASLLVSEYLRLSVRELRATIFEPLLFLWLLAVLRREDAPRWALLGLLVAFGVTALAADAQALLGWGGTEAEGVRRAQAWYPSPNHLALALGRVLPYLVALVVGPANFARRWWWWLTLAGTVVVTAGIVLTFSVGAWLGAVASTAVVLVVLGARRWAAALGGGAIVALLLVGALAAGGIVPERLNPFRATSGFRVELWLSALAMLRDHPILGVGLDNFVYLYQQVYLREGGAAEPNLAHPHNWVLDFWLSLGLAGLLAFLWLVVRIVRQGRAGLVPGRLLAERHWLVAGALGSLAALLTHGLLDNSYFLPDLAATFWLGALLADTATHQANQ